MSRGATKWGLAIWAVLCIGGMSLVNLEKLTEFDPQLKLSAAIADLTFETKLTAILQKQYKTTAKTTFHFSDNNCFCQLVAAKHVHDLTKNLDFIGFRNIHINLQDFPELVNYIPSTPSLAIFGDNNELIFLGPYAQGLGCISGTGLVDKVIQKLNTGQHENSLFITDSRGCYCQS